MTIKATTNKIKSNKDLYNSKNANVEGILKLFRTENWLENYDAILLPVLSTYHCKIVLFHQSHYKVIEDRTKINDSSRFL